MRKYLFLKKGEGWLYTVKGKVKEFSDAYECARYFRKNKLEEKGFVITTEESR